MSGARGGGSSSSQQTPRSLSRTVGRGTCGWGGRARMSWPWMKRKRFLKCCGSVNRSRRVGFSSPDCGVAALSGPKSMAPSGREDAASSAPTQSNSSVAPCSPSTRTTTSAKSDRFVCRSCNDVRISPSLRRTRVTGTSGPSCSSPGASNRRRLGARASISKRGAIDAPRPLLTRARGRYVRPGRHGVEDNALTGDACLCAPSRRLPLWSSTSVHSGQVPKPTRLPSRGSTCTRDAAATHTPRAHAPLVYNCISVTSHSVRALLLLHRTADTARSCSPAINIPARLRVHLPHPRRELHTAPPTSLPAQPHIIIISVFALSRSECLPVGAAHEGTRPLRSTLPPSPLLVSPLLRPPCFAHSAWAWRSLARPHSTGPLSTKASLPAPHPGHVKSAPKNLNSRPAAGKST